MKKPNYITVQYKSYPKGYEALNAEYGKPPYVVGETYDEVIEGLKKMFNLPKGYDIRLKTPMQRNAEWVTI